MPALPKPDVAENEDLEIFVNFLKSQNIEVVRPEKNNPNYYNYCPRDSVFIHNNLTLATPMPIKARKGEWKSLKKHLNNPIEVECSHHKNLYDIKCLNNKDTLALTEHSPAFDAANIIRANDDVLYLISNTGNKKGAQLLQELLGDKIKEIDLSSSGFQRINVTDLPNGIYFGRLLVAEKFIKMKKIIIKR